MNAKTTIFFGILCAIAITVGTWFAIPKISHSPHGIFLPANTYTPYTGKPSATVFIINRYPLTYQKLGTINIEEHFDGKSPNRIQQKVLAYAKALAAKHGATAIVVTQAYFDKPTGVEAGLGALHFQGTAIKVPQAEL
jgi:hypothetical protein